jgi:hypothetical protein
MMLALRHAAQAIERAKLIAKADRGTAEAYLADLLEAANELIDDLTKEWCS